MKSGYVKVKEISLSTKIAEMEKRELKKNILEMPLETKTEEISSMSEEEIKELFDRLDEDSSGSINLSDLKNILENTESDKQSSSVFQILSGLDTENLRTLTFNEFLEALNSKIATQNKKIKHESNFNNENPGSGLHDFQLENNQVWENSEIKSKLSDEILDEIKKIFRFADTYNSGYIDLENTKNIVQNKEESFNNTLIEIIIGMDSGKNQKVGIDDFIELITECSENSSFAEKMFKIGNKTQGCIKPIHFKEKRESYECSKVLNKNFSHQLNERIVK